MSLASLRPLRHRDFALLFAGGLVSNVGNWMQTVALGALVTQLTGRATWTALAATAAFLPIGVLSPLGGALADRLDRRRFLMGANLVEAALAVALAVLTVAGRSSPGAMTVLVFAGGCSSALRIPFQQAILPDLVGPEDLLPAVALGSTQYNLGRVVGPALAAAVVALGSFAWVFALNAASFLAVIAALALVRLPRPSPPDTTNGLWARIRAGARAAAAEPGCRAAIGLIAVAAFSVAPFIALVPAKATLLVDGGAEDVAAATGLLTTAQGVGAVLGALAIAPLAERLGRRHLLVLSLLATPTALVAYALSPTVALATAALGLVGALYIGILAGLGTVVQLRAPEEFRGRVLSFYFVALGTIYPIGTLVQGVVADAIGLAPTTILGAFLLVAVVAGLAGLRPSVLAALDEPEPGAVPGAAEVGTAELGLADGGGGDGGGGTGATR